MKQIFIEQIIETKKLNYKNFSSLNMGFEIFTIAQAMMKISFIFGNNVIGNGLEKISNTLIL